MTTPFKAGVLVWNQYTTWPDMRQAALDADRLAYDSLWTWDHLYPIIGDPTGPFLEAYTLLGLRSYLTTGEKETRAWTIRAGDKAPQAAGVIHSDFEKSFISAETTAYDDLMACGSFARCRELGKLRTEGKDYVVQDGDIMEFKTFL